MDLENPRQSRPKTTTLPGAAEQRAGIYNKMIFAGLSNLYNFDENFNHFIVVQGNYNDFRNPFITNFEKRYENNFTVRTHLNFAEKLKSWKMKKILVAIAAFLLVFTVNAQLEEFVCTPEWLQKIEKIIN